MAGSGFAFGCSSADFDNDGDLDLLRALATAPTSSTATTATARSPTSPKQSGLDDPRWSLQAVWFDYNGDGLLDVYVVNYLKYDGTQDPVLCPDRISRAR